MGNSDHGTTYTYAESKADWMDLMETQRHEGRLAGIEPPSRVSIRFIQSTLHAVYGYVVPWSEIPIVPSYPHYPYHGTLVGVLFLHTTMAAFRPGADATASQGDLLVVAGPSTCRHGAGKGITHRQMRGDVRAPWWGRASCTRPWLPPRPRSYIY